MNILSTSNLVTLFNYLNPTIKLFSLFKAGHVIECINHDTEQVFKYIFHLSFYCTKSTVNKLPSYSSIDQQNPILIYFIPLCNRDLNAEQAKTLKKTILKCFIFIFSERKYFIGLTECDQGSHQTCLA